MEKVTNILRKRVPSERSTSRPKPEFCVPAQPPSVALNTVPSAPSRKSSPPAGANAAVVGAHAAWEKAKAGGGDGVGGGDGAGGSGGTGGAGGSGVTGGVVGSGVVGSGIVASGIAGSGVTGGSVGCVAPGGVVASTGPGPDVWLI